MSSFPLFSSIILNLKIYRSIAVMFYHRYVTVGTTAAESMNAAANIFLGQTEVITS